MNVQLDLGGSFDYSSHCVSFSEKWYVIHTKPRREEVALANLERQGYECYLPYAIMEKVYRRKVETVKVPLFPRYLFVRLSNSCQDRSWAPIRSTHGVSRLVTFGDRAIHVDDKIVELLRKRELARLTEALFCQGDTVVINEGPLVGVEAIFQTSCAERRSMILLDMLSRSVSLWVDTAQLGKVD